MWLAGHLTQGRREDVIAFEALELSFELIDALRKPVDTIQGLDRDLARQIRRAASSIALNVAEGCERTAGDKLQAYRIAHGSAREVRAALRIAVGWGYVSRERTQRSVEQLDRICAMCWRLTRSGECPEVRSRQTQPKFANEAESRAGGGGESEHGDGNGGEDGSGDGNGDGDGDGGGNGDGGGDGDGLSNGPGESRSL